MTEDNAAIEAEETSEETVGNAENAAEESGTQENAASENATSEGAASENAAAQDASAEVGSTPEAAAGENQESAEASAEALPARDADGFSSGLPETESAPRKHIPGGIGYEVIYAVPSGDQQLVDDSSQRLRDVIEGICEGAVDNIRASEVRRFAYPIQKQTEGVYVVVNARFKPEHTGELDRHFKLDESVLRHMVLKEDN